jgi:monoterpene epsilon-lactone hydrolase
MVIRGDRTTISEGKQAFEVEIRVSGMPPVRIHVGDDEVLLDDSRRYVDRAVAAGVDARLDVWMGMPHGFPASVAKLKAAGQALDAVAAFLTQRLQGRTSR